MAFVTLEDLYGAVECIVFPATYDRYGRFIEEDNLVVVKGRVSISEEDEPKILCESISKLNSFKEEKVYLKIAKGRPLDTFNTIKEVLSRYRGHTPVYVYMEEIEKTVMAQRDLWVNIEEKPLLEELAKILGKENVKVS